ncbi:MAG: hypothetical protein ACE5EV_06735 [Gaiellales bacterium]
MYARITNFQGDPANIDAMEARIGEITESVQALPGAQAVYAAWREDGAGVVTAIYESRAAAEAAAPQVREIWAVLGEFLSGPPSAEGYETVVRLKG